MYKYFLFVDILWKIEIKYLFFILTWNKKLQTNNQF